MTAKYSTVKEIILAQIQKTYKNGQDIVASIKQGKKLGLSRSAPTHQKSAKSEADRRDVEQKGFNIKYQEN